MGPVRKGDTLELMECEREARRLRWFTKYIIAHTFATFILSLIIMLIAFLIPLFRTSLSQDLYYVSDA